MQMRSAALCDNRTKNIIQLFFKHFYHNWHCRTKRTKCIVVVVVVGIVASDVKRERDALWRSLYNLGRWSLACSCRNGIAGRLLLPRKVCTAKCIHKTYYVTKPLIATVYLHLIPCNECTALNGTGCADCGTVRLAFLFTQSRLITQMALECGARTVYRSAFRTNNCWFNRHSGTGT